ncbi:MAG: AraC family transcriptional regulator [Phenylobacterium zucineum]|nr:MAG: AraC family transcriptional regulator [Phenylobacterium zucineum]
MGGTETWSNEAIISDALGLSPDVELGSTRDGWKLCRWRQFVGSYALPALPAPTFVVHIGGKPQVKVWDRDGWSEASSTPGYATILPLGMPSRWLVDGELDVVTLSLGRPRAGETAADQFRRLRFAFADPLGVALTRQVLAELYAPATAERDVYVGTLVNTLTAHVARNPGPAPAAIPNSFSSAHRLHHLMALIRDHPEGDHSLEEMAAIASLTPSHFSRVFKRATGATPHQYVLKTRLDRGRHMLSHSDLPLAHISEFLGFKSQSHFTRAFRQHVGETPSDYRRRGRE